MRLAQKRPTSSRSALSAFLLYRWRQGDANVRSVWLCSRNDAIGNIAVFMAALVTARVQNGWPDLIVAMGLASLFVNSSLQIIRQALAETKADR